MSKNSTQPSSPRSISPKILPEADTQRANNSRSRFELYRQKVRHNGLAHGSVHSSGEPRAAKSRVRSAKQLVWQFGHLLAPFRRQVFWILASATVANLLGLMPPARAKFILDSRLKCQP